LDSKALTRVQSAVLIAIIVVAAVAGSVAYVVSSGTGQSKEAIKMGICADIDNTVGKPVLRGATLAVEQINAAGGVLGRNLTIVAEDDDSESGGDIAVGTNAMTRLITVDHADFIITPQSTNALLYQDIAADHKIILFQTYGASSDNLTQRVADNYEKYKYYFRIWPSNSSQTAVGFTNALINIRDMTGFNKIAYIDTDVASVRALSNPLETALPESNFTIVYRGFVTPTTTDFTSYFDAIEASGAEIVIPLIFTAGPANSFVKEWCERQSPFILWGPILGGSSYTFWNSTGGKCEYLSCNGLAAVVGYPLTNKTIQTKESFIERWGVNPTDGAVAAYDVVRFILPDAIERAKTTETNALVKTLETSQVETSMARHWAFSSDHDPLVTYANPLSYSNPNIDHMLVMTFQWQAGGTQVPVGPKSIRIESGATYKFPPWKGPWGNRTEAP
jgi:branched-chain amino acid transport system substrate-binding protein